MRLKTSKLIIVNNTLKNTIAILFIFISIQLIAQQPIINNPLPVGFGDPYILKASNSIYYMVGTG